MNKMKEMLENGLTVVLAAATFVAAAILVGIVLKGWELYMRGLV